MGDHKAHSQNFSRAHLSLEAPGCFYFLSISLYSTTKNYYGEPWFQIQTKTLHWGGLNRWFLGFCFVLFCVFFAQPLRIIIVGIRTIKQKETGERGRKRERWRNSERGRNRERKKLKTRNSKLELYSDKRITVLCKHTLPTGPYKAFLNY